MRKLIVSNPRWRFLAGLSLATLVAARQRDRIIGVLFGDPGPYRVQVGRAIPMPDGVVLRADHYAPIAPGPFPTLLQRTPSDPASASVCMWRAGPTRAGHATTGRMSQSPRPRRYTLRHRLSTTTGSILRLSCFRLYDSALRQGSWLLYSLGVGVWGLGEPPMSRRQHAAQHTLSRRDHPR
jgi:hypothetical protein